MLELVKNHIQDIYKTLEPSKIVINHDLLLSKSIDALESKSNQYSFLMNVSFKYESLTSQYLQSVFPNCSYSFNVMDDIFLKNFDKPLPVKKLALNLNKKFD